MNIANTTPPSALKAAIRDVIPPTRTAAAPFVFVADAPFPLEVAVGATDESMTLVPEVVGSSASPSEYALT